MTELLKGVRSFFRSNKPAENAKPELPRETRVNDVINKKKHSITSPFKSFTKGSITNDSPKPKKTPKKPTEPPPRAPNSNAADPKQRTVRYGIPDVEITHDRLARTLAEIREISADFDEDSEAAIQEMLELTKPREIKAPETDSMSGTNALNADELGTLADVFEDPDVVELMKELERLVPDPNDEETSISISSRRVDAETALSVSSKTGSKPAGTEAVKQDLDRLLKEVEAKVPKPRPLRRGQHPIRQTIAPGISPEQAGVRRRREITIKTPEK
jgi:hypothetical protein